MSTRHVWEKWNRITKYRAYEGPVTAESGKSPFQYNTGSSIRLCYSTDVTVSFNETNGYYSVEFRKVVDLGRFEIGDIVTIPANAYLDNVVGDSVSEIFQLSSPNIFFTGNDSAQLCIEAYGSTGVQVRPAPGYQVRRKFSGSYYAQGPTTYGGVSAGSNTAYPNNTYSGSYWYIYQGSDSIDPSAVSILDTPKAGKEVAVSVAPVTNTYGGTISYAYEYSADGGASWQAIQTTTETEVVLSVPEDAETLQVRVRASDDMGFTSADYVTSEAVAVKAAGGVTLSIDGIMREADGLYCCVDGVLRPASGTAALDGIQRDIF